MCGCARLEALASPKCGKTEKTKDVERAQAETMRGRWGCGTRRALPLAKTHADAASAFEKLVGAPSGSCDGCPFEGVYHRDVTDGWLAELLSARLLVVDEHVPWPDALSRDLLHVDVKALLAWKTASARMRAFTPPKQPDAAATPDDE